MLKSAAETLTQAPSQVISVGELTRLVRRLLEQRLPLMWIAGEVSNCRRQESGHCYFTLKDTDAQVECVLFRQKGQLLGWVPRDGMQVEVRAFPTLYEPRGRFQLCVETMRRSGFGALYEAFARLKLKLEQEGLFNAERKRALPRFPRVIGIITSPQAAALRDVLTACRRRMSSLVIIIYPTSVQGAAAAQDVAGVIRAASARKECDLLIVCRGGGSIEDLWAFNTELVARAIAASSIPVVTGIGHETDFTIADFVADVRAATPTGAAERASVDQSDLVRMLSQTARRLLRCATRSMEERMQRIDFLSRRLMHPGERVRAQRAALQHLAQRLCASMRHSVENESWQLRDLAQRMIGAGPDPAALRNNNAELGRRLRHAARARIEEAKRALASAEAHLRHLSPLHVLERGYSITESAAGSIVRDAATLAAGEEVKITFARGSARARVQGNNKVDG
jgi:exodeoxyribonuclease VII large subunit